MQTINKHLTHDLQGSSKQLKCQAQAINKQSPHGLQTLDKVGAGIASHERTHGIQVILIDKQFGHELETIPKDYTRTGGTQIETVS